MQQLIQNGDWLPYAFAVLMGLSLFIYAVLDGYDLGVGILTKGGSNTEKDIMISSIGPFWDANETWLVLAVGILLVAFPKAHGLILTNLYLPVAVMLLGLIFRGVAFDFRTKVPSGKKERWNGFFFWGSLLTSLSQGYMLGSYFVGFDQSGVSVAFSLLVGITLTIGYALMGACWLIMKCEGELQRKAIRAASAALGLLAVCVVIVSVLKPFVTPRVLENVASMPDVIAMAPMPFVAIGMAALMAVILKSLPLVDDKMCWLPFVLTIGLFSLFAHGLVYNLYPYAVPGTLTLVDAASAPESLFIIFVGTIVVFPILVGYTVLVYWIFHGKAQELKYD